MDILKLIPELWRLLVKGKYAINVTTIDNALVVSILKRKRIRKRFTNIDSSVVLSDIRNYLQA